MKSLGLQGVRRGKVKRTTIADAAAHRPRDLVERRFGPLAPNLLWVADITYVSTWSGWVYVAFVTDAYARRILGWRTSTSMSTQLVLDAVEHAIWTRGRHGVADLGGVIHHTDAGSQIYRGAVLRASRRGRHLGFGWQRWGFVRQCARGDDQRPVQNRADQTPRTLAHRRAGRVLPPPNGSTGSNHRRLYEYCGDIRQPNWRPPTTVNTSPAFRSGAQKQSDRTCRCDSKPSDVSCVTRTTRSSFSSCGVGMHQCRFRRFGRRRSCGRRGGQFRV